MKNTSSQSIGFLLLIILCSCKVTNKAQMITLDHAMKPQPTIFYRNYAEWFADSPKKAAEIKLIAGHISISNKAFQIIARDINKNGRFDDEGIDAIGVAGSKSEEECAYEKDGLCPNIRLYSKNMTARVDDSYYLIEHVRQDGNEVKVKVKTLKDPIVKPVVTIYQTLPFFLKVKNLSEDKEKSFRELIDPKAKYVFLNFWSPYCAPCLEEIPLINKFSSEGLAIVNICEHSYKKDAPKIIKNYDFKGEHVYIEESMAKDLQQYGCGFPYGNLYDAKGNLIQRNISIGGIQAIIDKL